MKIIMNKKVGFNKSITDALSYSTCRTCLDLKASAIISATSTGYTAAAVSRFRPISPIIAATSNEKVMRKMFHEPAGTSEEGML